MAERTGHSENFSRVASGNLPFGRVATLIGKDAVLATSGQLAYPVMYRADDNQHVSLVSGGHAKVTYGSSLGVGAHVMAGGSGFVTLAASGQHVIGQTLSAADSGGMGEINVHISQKSLA